MKIDAKVQIVSYSGKQRKYDGSENIVQSKFGSVHALDDYDVTVIDLTDANIWEFSGNSYGTINSIGDFISLRSAIELRKKSKLMIILPPDCNFKYRYSMGTYYSSEKIKDILDSVLHIISKITLCDFNLVQSLTTSNLGGHRVKAEFVFSVFDSNCVILKSDGSNQPIAIKKQDIVFTTLQPENKTELLEILKATNLVCLEKTDPPEWFGSIERFNDKEIKDLIKDSQSKIAALEDSIAKYKNILIENNKYKSVLYLQNQELVDVVFSMLEEMLEIDLSTFVDEKNEDFRFENNGLTYIGEIKGISQNVQSKNITQLELHRDCFMEKNPEIPEENIVSILIINHQRKDAPDLRIPVNQKQIDIAKNRDCLIIETTTLLDMYELFKCGKLNSKDCLKLLGTKGLLSNIK